MENEKGRQRRQTASELRSKQIEEIKQTYPPGTRLKLIRMEDPYAPVPAGTCGSVKLVDDSGQIHMEWDNGRTLAVIPQVDQFRKLTEQELAVEQNITITPVTVDDLRRMQDREGLVLQGCGGNLREWVDGINQILTEEGILKKGARLEEAYSFQHDGLTCLLFPFKDDLEMDAGRLAVWRLQTHSSLGSTWLSDYVPNRLGGFIQEQNKPDCPLIGADGNIYNLMGIAGRTLREHGMEEQAEEMFNRITQCQSYDSALNMIGDYVNITSVDEVEEKFEDSMRME